MMPNNGSQYQEETASLENMEFTISKIILYLLILVLSSVGNILVSVVLIRARNLRTSSNLLILNLAACDFLTPIISIPFDLALEELRNIWPFGRTVCKLLWPLQTVFSTSSSLILAAISLDRYRTLVKPFLPQSSLGTNVLLVLTVHAFSICLCIPYFIALEYNPAKKSCNENWPAVRYRQVYTVFLFLCQYALPLITMSIAYVLIYRSLRSNLARLFPVNSGRCQKSRRRTHLSKDSVEFKRKEQNIRLAKMFVIVVVVFAISMFPNQVLWFWHDFGNGGESAYFHYISVVCRLCTYANSVLNPFIYALKSREFRSGFAKIGHSTVVKPLRKISAETRRFVRKVSANVNVLDNQRSLVDTTSLATEDISPMSGDYSETFKPSWQSAERIRDTESREITLEFERQKPCNYVPRRKFSCYEIGEVKGLNVKSNEGSTLYQSDTCFPMDSDETPKDREAVINLYTSCKNLEKVKLFNDISFPELKAILRDRSSWFIKELRETDC